MTDLSQDIETHGIVECGNCPNELRRVRNKEVEQCPKCGAEAYPIKGLPEPVDWTPVQIEEETECR